MKKSALVLAPILVTLYCQAQSLPQLQEQYNARTVVTAISLLQKPGVFQKVLDKLPYDSSTGLYQFPAGDSLNRLIKEADQLLTTIPGSEAARLYKKTAIVASLYIIITTSARTCCGDKEDPLTQSAYLTKCTRQLFKPYITDARLQDWNSLSFFETNALFKDLLNFIADQSPTGQRNILAALLNTLFTAKLD